MCMHVYMHGSKEEEDAMVYLRTEALQCNAGFDSCRVLTSCKLRTAEARAYSYLVRLPRLCAVVC